MAVWTILQEYPKKRQITLPYNTYPCSKSVVFDTDIIYVCNIHCVIGNRESHIHNDPSARICIPILVYFSCLIILSLNIC